ncbi:MAG: PAS domain S-box protein [Ferruginibacter sp.]
MRTNKIFIIAILLLAFSIVNLFYISIPAYKSNGTLPLFSLITLLLSVFLIQQSLKVFLTKKNNVVSLVQLNNELKQHVLTATNELANSKKIFTDTLDKVSDAFVILDLNLCYTYMNKKAGEIFQRDPIDLIGKEVRTEFPEGTEQLFYHTCRKAIDTNQYICLQGYYQSFELWLESHIYPSSAGLSIFFCDITEQKKSEKKINKLNRLYLFISHINHMIARTTDEATLFKDACDIAVEIGKFKMAWIGQVTGISGPLTPFTYEGMDPDQLSIIKTLADKDPIEGNGPFGTTWKNGKYIVCNNIKTDTATVAWRTDALEKNYNSSITLPIKKFGNIVATFNLYADPVNFFDAKEIALLEDTTGDISFALEVFEKESLRRIAEEAVLASERRYQTLTEVCPVGIFHTDATGYTTYVNPSWCQTSGLSREEALGNGWLKAVHAEDRQSLTIGWQEATKIHETSFSEYRFLQPDGTVTWVIGQAIPEWDFEGRIAGYVGTTTDITNRKTAEEEIKKANERFELIAKATNDVIWDWNLLTGELWWNENYYSLFGYDESALRHNIGSWNHRIHPDDRARVLGGIHQAIDSGEYHWQDQYRYLKKDNAIVLIYDRGFILHNEQGKPYRMMGSMLDVTELKKAQEEIIKERNLSDSIINSLPGVFYLFTKEGKYLRWNKNFEKVTMYTPEEIRKIHPLDLFEGEEKGIIAEKIASTFISGEANVQASFVNKAAIKTPYYFTGIPIDYEGNQCLMGVGIDFSERVLAQEKLEQTSAQLRKLAVHLQTIREEERRRIGREIHDELGQQLTAIKMDIAWIDKKIPEEPIQLKNKLKNVIQLLDGSNKSIRRILSELRPGVLEDHGLQEAIGWLIDHRLPGQRAAQGLEQRRHF